jgi:hypothetical protein
VSILLYQAQKNEKANSKNKKAIRRQEQSKPPT